MYSLRFPPAAVTDLDRLPTHVRRRVLATIRGQLATDPVTLTRHRKIIVTGARAVRQLRVGDYRVFYDVRADEDVVMVWGIRRKGRRTTGEIL